MSNRLDEVFSLERLRRTWKAAEAPPQTPSSREEEGSGGAPSHGASAAEVSYKRLRAAIERSFPPSCAATLGPLLVELEQLLMRRFPAGPHATISLGERTKITLAIDGLLNRIEDLLEAFEVGLNRGRS
jgi:hypothetical protein